MRIPIYTDEEEMVTVIMLLLTMLMSQLMAAQAPGLWQSQLANAAARIEPPSPPAQVYTYSPLS